MANELAYYLSLIKPDISRMPSGIASGFGLGYSVFG